MRPARAAFCSGSVLVLVDNAAEDVAADDPAAGFRGDRAWHRLGEIQAAMRPGLVVVASGEGGNERSIGPGEAGRGDLTANYGQLVAQHKDLSVLGESVHPVDPDQLDLSMREKNRPPS